MTTTDRAEYIAELLCARARHEAAHRWVEADATQAEIDMHIAALRNEVGCDLAEDLVESYRL